jgi:glutathione-regulated potassium-efflux system ancillary protein KefG
MRELLAPWDQTAHLCGMRFLAPFVVHGALRLATDDDVAAHRDAYARLLAALRDDRVDLDAAAAADDLRAALDRVVAPGGAP